MIHDFFLNAPVIIKVMSTLAVILIINSTMKKLLPALLCGALLLAFWTGQTPATILLVSREKLLSSNTILLLLTVCQVMWMSRQMELTGVMEEMVGTVRGKLSKRGAMATLPGLIGFLPMPGGALFSAPMLQSCDPENQAASAIKAQTNHWFRHVWECWWPMYPGVLLTMELTGFDVPQMLMLGLPLSIASIVIGYFFLLRRIPVTAPDNSSLPPRNKTSLIQLLRLMSPIIIVIASYAIIRITHSIAIARNPELPAINRYLPMNIGLLLATGFLQWKRPIQAEQWKKTIFSWKVFTILLIVMTVTVYSGFIEAESPAGYHLIEEMRRELQAWGIPMMAVIMILPFVTGLATGMAVGYIGASFPIILSLIGETPSFGDILANTLVAYGFGYMGFVLSPVHVCLILSSKFFNTEVLRNVASLLPSALLMLVFTMILSRFWQLVLP